MNDRNSSEITNLCSYEDNYVFDPTSYKDNGELLHDFNNCEYAHDIDIVSSLHIIQKNIVINAWKRHKECGLFLCFIKSIH